MTSIFTWIPDDFSDEQTVVCVDYRGVLFADGRLIPLKDYIHLPDENPVPDMPGWISFYTED